MHRLRILCSFLTTVWLFGHVVFAQEPASALGGGVPAVWNAEKLTAEPLQEALSAATGTLEKIPADVVADSPEGRLRAHWKRRVELLRELIATLQARQELDANRSTLPERRAQLETDLRALDASVEPVIPTQPVTEESEALKTKLDAQRQGLDALRQEASARAKLVDSLPTLRNSATERETTAQKTAVRLRTELEAEKEEAARSMLALQLENAELETRVARENLSLLEAQVALESTESIYRNQAIAYSQHLMQRTEEHYNRYQKALANALQVRQQQAQDELATRKEAAQKATSDAGQLLTRWEANIAESQAARAALEIRKSVLSTLISQQEKRLQAERDRLLTLRELTGGLSVSGRAGEALKSTYYRIRQLRRSPERIYGPSVRDELEQHRSRRFELDEQIFSMFDMWRLEVGEAAATLPAAQRADFEKEAARLRDAYRTALLEEHALLTEVISSESSIQDLGLRLSAALDELETFILPKLFWIRDAQPLGISTLSAVLEEVGQLTGWLQGLLKPATRQEAVAALLNPASILLELVLLGAIPPVLVGLRGRLRTAVVDAGKAGRGTHATLLALGSTAALVFYLGVLAIAIRMVGLPEALGSVAEGLLLQLTWLAFFWQINRSFIRPGGIAEVHYGLAPDTARTLYLSARFTIGMSLLLLVPWVLLRQPPFRLEILPRLCFTMFGVGLLVPVFQLLRASSPVMRDLHPGARHPRFRGNWRIVSSQVLLVLCGSVMMDALGYRYGGFQIARATILTAITVAVALTLYKVLLPLSLRILDRRRGEVTATPGDAPLRASRDRRTQIRAFLKTSLIVVSVLLVATWWGVNQRAISALDTIHVWKASADPVVWVSVADLLQCLLVMVLTIWLVRNLPGLYEVAIFPRLELDGGARYAVLTISKYGLFVIGALTALATISLNLNQLGWLMAAVGFGLGFGMQEIFSNFVSGLILLLERPVRVGDIVRVGEVIGTVTRINIRATTITTADRIETIIPNKDLITRNVTNWTLADKITRMVLPIRAAYGSDIDQVRSILYELAQQQPEILKDPAPEALFMNHGESSLDFELRFFVGAPEQRMPLQDRMNTLINKTLTAHGISIPFPQCELHIRSDTPEGMTSLGSLLGVLRER